MSPQRAKLYTLLEHLLRSAAALKTTTGQRLKELCSDSGVNESLFDRDWQPRERGARY